jgi:hypothetical protein
VTAPPWVGSRKANCVTCRGGVALKTEPSVEGLLEGSCGLRLLGDSWWVVTLQCEVLLYDFEVTPATSWKGQ